MKFTFFWLEICKKGIRIKKYECPILTILQIATTSLRTKTNILGEGGGVIEFKYSVLSFHRGIRIAGQKFHTKLNLHQQNYYDEI